MTGKQLLAEEFNFGTSTLYFTIILLCTVSKWNYVLYIFHYK